jgi:hypothetical protein
MTRVTITKRTIATAFVVAGLVGLPALARSQDPKPITDSVTITATIEAIDKTAKKVTLKGPKGNFVEVDATDVPRFDQLKVGDQVSATYYESLAVHVRKPGDPAPTAGSGAVTPREGAPGATAARQRTVTVTVEAIDMVAPSVTIKTAVPRPGPEEPRNRQGGRQGRRDVHGSASREGGSACQIGCTDARCLVPDAQCPMPKVLRAFGFRPSASGIPV